MIRTVADLITELVAAERKLLNAEKITHRPTIGGMWENLSRDILDRTLPCEGLFVGSGFVEDPNGKQSLELDCVLATGPGRAIHRSEKRIFAPNEVVAVAQIKKVLYQKDISEGFDNLWSLLPLEFAPPKNTRHTVRRAFESITRTPLPDDVNLLPAPLRQLHDMLLGDAIYPCRILLGYHGFKTESTFRQGLRDHIEKLESIKGWGPTSFPNFVIGPNAVAMKNTALPWGTPLVGDWWPLLLTTDEVPSSLVFLEAIWTKLNHLGMADAAVFGDDLQLEPWTRLVDARFKEGVNWELRFLDVSPGASNADPTQAEWSPAFVSQPAFVLANMLCSRDPDPVDVSEIGPPDEINSAVDELRDAGIAARDGKNPALVYLLTSGCACVILPDGRYAAGENNSGRLERWVARFMAQRQPGNPERGE